MQFTEIKSKAITYICLGFSSLSLLLMSPAVIAQPHASQTSSSPKWQSSLLLDHSLVGKVWHSASQTFITEAQLFDALGQSQYLLLGEKHDNPDHHLLQGKVLQYLIEENKIGRVAFEMMESDKQSLLDNIDLGEITSEALLKTYLSWDDEGWDWPFYGPLINASLQAGLKVTAANITSAEMMRVYQQPQDEAVARVLDESVIAQLNLDIDESHCQLLPESQFPAMVRVQQSRDYQMAEALLGANSGSKDLEPQGAGLGLLIAGNYHIRQDLAVPNYLLARDARLERDQILSLALMEVSAEATQPEDYQQRFNDVTAFDYIWFTPAISNQDYCASLQ